MGLLRAEGHEPEPMDYWGQIAAILVGAPAIGAAARGEDRVFGAIDPRPPVGAAQGY
jgi:gamma-glutamyltranspeptidase/glutathione hydrolase